MLLKSGHRIHTSICCGHLLNPAIMCQPIGAAVCCHALKYVTGLQFMCRDAVAAVDVLLCDKKNWISEQLKETVNFSVCLCFFSCGCCHRQPTDIGLGLLCHVSSPPALSQVCKMKWLRLHLLLVLQFFTEHINVVATAKCSAIYYTICNMNKAIKGGKKARYHYLFRFLIEIGADKLMAL